MKGKIVLAIKEGEKKGSFRAESNLDPQTVESLLINMAVSVIRKNERTRMLALWKKEGGLFTAQGKPIITGTKDKNDG